MNKRQTEKYRDQWMRERERRRRRRGGGGGMREKHETET